MRYTRGMHGPSAGNRITIMGLGRFGGGSGVTRWLLLRGADVLVTDQLDEEDLAAPLAQLRGIDGPGALQLRLGGHDASDFTGADMVVANPAVPRPWDHPCLKAAWDAGVPVTTEIALLLERLDRTRVIGVTGTSGKSTTAAMIHHILQRLGIRSCLGGNIGGSLLPRIDEVLEADAVVLELSSAMLWWLGAMGEEDSPPGAINFSPHLAVTTNITPNHLDWHGSEDHYRRCKEGIVRWQDASDIAITTDPANEQLVPLRIPGQHNQANARLAVEAVVRFANLDPSEAIEVIKTLSDFPGLPHRLQCVAEVNGCRFFDDSKSTTPEATRLAIEAFDHPSRVHVVVGGYDKGISMEPLAALADRVAGLYTIGSTGAEIARSAASGRQVHECSTLDSAVQEALKRMEDTHVLLLSPGCASWDQFENYEARGRAFQELVSAST